MTEVMIISWTAKHLLPSLFPLLPISVTLGCHLTLKTHLLNLIRAANF